MDNDFSLLLPEILVGSLAFMVIAADFVTPSDRKQWLAYGCAGALAAILAFTLCFLGGRDAVLYGGTLRVDAFALFFKGFFLVLAIAVILSSVDYVERRLEHHGEYYGILLFTVVGAMFLASSGELLTAYISLELLSFGLYALVGFERFNPRSNEAAAKYILLGALSSAFLLYGISQVYGHLGDTTFEGIAQALSAMESLSPGLLLGVVLILAGLAFKVAAVPFHMWAPDVYEGAPTPIAAYLAVGSKAAAVALFMRLFAEGFLPASAEWRMPILFLAAASMVTGNLLAIPQTNVKRLLAYSSIGHAGYLLMGIAALATSAPAAGGDAIARSQLAAGAIMLHLVAYGAANMGAFLVVSMVSNARGGESIRTFAGMNRWAPGVAAALAASLFSLAGLPVFAGFVSKFYLFTAAAANGLLWLAALAIVMSLVSLYYYLVVIRQAYIERSEDVSPLAASRPTYALLAALFAGVVIVGVYPSPVMEAIQAAAAALFAP